MSYIAIWILWGFGAMITVAAIVLAVNAAIILFAALLSILFD